MDELEQPAAVAACIKVVVDKAHQNLLVFGECGKTFFKDSLVVLHIVLCAVEFSHNCINFTFCCIAGVQVFLEKLQSLVVMAVIAGHKGCVVNSHGVHAVQDRVLGALICLLEELLCLNLVVCHIIEQTGVVVCRADFLCGLGILLVLIGIFVQLVCLQKSIGAPCKGIFHKRLLHQPELEHAVGIVVEILVVVAVHRIGLAVDGALFCGELFALGEQLHFVALRIGVYVRVGVIVNVIVSLGKLEPGIVCTGCLGVLELVFQLVSILDKVFGLLGKILGRCAYCNRKGEHDNYQSFHSFKYLIIIHLFLLLPRPLPWEPLLRCAVLRTPQLWNRLREG